MKTFCTMIATSDPSNLLKDVGMVPYHLKDRYDSCLASYIHDSMGIYGDQVAGLRQESLGPGDGKNHCLDLWNRDCVRFLKKNSRDIDILNLYFLKHSILYGLLYKALNPDGLLYVKMDGNVLKMEKEASERFSFIRTAVFRRYLRHVVDKISIESLRGYEFMKEKYGLNESRLMYLPNGYADALVSEPLGWEEKDNVFLCVGRLGAPEKRTGMLLEAASKVHWKKGWELHLVGPVEPGFEKKEIDGVKWLGPEYDHRKLYEMYDRAKAFCLTSEYESFGIVCVEAQAFGEYLLLTPFSTASDFTENGELGKIVHDADELAAAMQEMIDDDSHAASVMPRAVEHAVRYRWSSLADRLYNFLEDIA